MGDSNNNGNLANALKGPKYVSVRASSRADAERHSGHHRHFYKFTCTECKNLRGGIEHTLFQTRSGEKTPTRTDYRRWHRERRVYHRKVEEPLRQGALGAQPRPGAPQRQVYRGAAPACHQARGPTVANIPTSRASGTRNCWKWHRTTARLRGTSIPG